MSERTLVKKLAKVMTEVKYIEKKGYNAFHKYKFARESDVAEKVREVLAEQNVMMIPNMLEQTTREHMNAKGNREYIVSVKMEFKFIDGDSGEELSLHMNGDGQDAGDKAIYKAITGAQKYALMKVFMIPTGDDPEADESADERNNGEHQQNSNVKPITPKTLGILKAKALEYANLRSKTLEDVYEVLSITDITKLSQNEASERIKAVEKWIEKAKAEQAS